MKRFDAADLSLHITRLQDILALHQVRRALKLREAVSAEEIARYAQDLDDLQAFCQRIDLSSSAHIISLSKNQLQAANCPDLSTLAAIGQTVSGSITTELTDHRFIAIHKDLIRFVDDVVLFGESVYDAFPSARKDIKDAGNCIAVDCNTAAVFHLNQAGCQ